MKKIFEVIRREPMLAVSLAAAALSLIFTPPSAKLLGDIDWRTLGTLFMMLATLEGFKSERVLSPLLKFAGKLKKMTSVTFFLVFGVFFTSMFVTNDVSLIIFVPLTIAVFRAGRRERYILPVITLENIAAVRGSLLTPFGSPQNLFFYGKSGIGFGKFLLMMLPLSVMSAVLLSAFILFIYRHDLKEELDADGDGARESAGGKRWFYLALFALVVATIVTRTSYWYVPLAAVVLLILVFDRKTLLRVDYVLLLTFLCFFVFSSSVASNGSVSEMLRRAVAGNEYWWSIGLSQVISNVPSTIVLYPFSVNLKALIYGADTAGLVSVIGSLASVINYRIYVREYPGQGKKFLTVFTLVSLAFFAIVVAPGYFLSLA